MAYVKFDKEFAAAVKQNLNEINEEITLTLSSISSSFYNKKISLYSSFLKVYDEEGNIAFDYTNQAIRYNNAADNGGDRASTIGSSVATKVNKVVNALDKVISLVETFESQTGLSIESEVGDLSSAFQFLATYGDASSLSALKGTGLFGNASLDGIYDFDESIFDYDGLSIWSSFSGFLEEQDGEGELENSIREFFLGKLNGFLDKDGNVIIDGKNLGALNSLSMATLLQTDAGQKMKDEFENDYKDKMMQMFFSEGSKEEGMVPFGQSQSSDQELMASIVSALGISSALLGSVTPNTDVGTDEEKDDEKNHSRTIVSSIYDVLTGNSELLEDNKNAGLFVSLVDVFEQDLTDDNVLELMESIGLSTSESNVMGEAAATVGGIAGGVIQSGGGKNLLDGSLVEGVGNSESFGELDAPSIDEFQAWAEEHGLEGSLSDLYSKHYQEFKNGLETGSVSTALGEMAGGIAEGSVSTPLDKLVNLGNEMSNEIKKHNEQQIEVSTLESKQESGHPISQGGGSKAEQSISQEGPSGNGHPINQGGSSNHGNSGHTSPNSGSSHFENKQISETPQSQDGNQNYQEEFRHEVNEPADNSSNQNQVVTTEDNRPSVSTQLPDLPTIKKPESGNDTTVSAAEVEIPEVGTEKIKASTAVVGAAGIGATAILGSGNNNVSLPSISVDMSAPTVNAAPTINLDVDLPAAATNVAPSNSGVANTVTSSGTPTVDNSGVMTNNTTNTTNTTNTANATNVTNANSSAGRTTSSAASTTTHSTASSSSQSETLGKGKSSYGAPSDAKSGSTSKAQSSGAKVESEQQEQRTKVEDLDKKLEVDAPEGVLGDSSYAELIAKNEKEVKVATAVTVSSLAFALALKLTNVIGIVSFILVLLAIVLVYTTFRVKKGKERKKLESLIIIEKIKKEEEIKTEVTSVEDIPEESVVAEEVETEATEIEETSEEVAEVEVTEITEPSNETEVTVTEEVVQEEQPDENVIYQEEIVYVDEDGNVIELPEGAEIVYEEVVVEEETPVQEVEIPEKKEFQSAEEVIYGEMPKESSDK